jgi:hypothetical protein
VGLSEEVIQQLARLGYARDSDWGFWKEMWESEGESFVLGFLQKEEEAVQEYRLWFPRLQTFEKECRQATPIPSEDSFSIPEAEQFRILRIKMEQFLESEDRRCILNRKPHQAAIISTTRIGLAAAQEVFADSGAILLLDEERDRWYSEIYQPSSEGFWWYSFAWWTVQEGLSEEDEQDILQHYPIPEGNSYWVVISGVSWGSLAGGANHELWNWDGSKAEFIEVYRIDTY